MKCKKIFGICLGLAVAAGVCLMAGGSQRLPQLGSREKMLIVCESLPSATPDGLAGKEGNAATAASTPDIEGQQPDVVTNSPPPQAAEGPAVAGLETEPEPTPSANTTSDSAPVPASVRIEMAPPTTTEDPCSTEMSQQSTAVPAVSGATDTTAPEQEAPMSTPEKVKPTLIPTPELPIPTPTETPSETPQPTPEPLPAPEQTPDPAFDIAGWISFAQDYAVSLGLNLDSTATACWDAPIVAGAHRTELAADIQSRLARYARDETILDVWVWSVPRGDGTFDLYIGYA